MYRYREFKSKLSDPLLHAVVAARTTKVGQAKSLKLGQI